MEIISIDEIISHLSETYASCTSYRDKGTVKMYKRTAHGDSCVSDNIFETIAIPPRLFRFEFTDLLFTDDQRNILVMGPCGLRSTAFECSDDMSFSDAVAMMHGISKGSASFIPTLMFKSLTALLESRVVDLPFSELTHETHGAVEYYVLKTELGESITCQKDTFLIKCARTYLSPSSEMYLSFDFNSVSINEPIAVELFQIS